MLHHTNFKRKLWKAVKEDQFCHTMAVATNEMAKRAQHDI